ncbi:hypothetical protein AGLY_017785 [Aphis glycines]|uniref:L1 transposable element RRM domain-containing protein n=1 Tax=Aphis glycines TaxID=307491 RepID=A0A6G0SV23_APHGL|nr:hypothetical protein AGLY_017785 [Aphis glycines]
MENQLTEINTSLNELKSSQNKIINSVNEQGKILKNFNKKFEDILEQINKLSTENSELKNRITFLEENFKTSNKGNEIYFEQNIINELFDRQYRAKNIIVYNLPEAVSDSNNINSDENQIKLIINELKLNYKSMKLHRLGRPTNKDRPLKATFSEVNHTFDILRSQSNLRITSLWSNIRISSDRTEKQREIMSNLRKELEYRRNGDETDIIIKIH